MKKLLFLPLLGLVFGLFGQEKAEKPRFAFSLIASPQATFLTRSKVFPDRHLPRSSFSLRADWSFRLKEKVWAHGGLGFGRLRYGIFVSGTTRFVEFTNVEKTLEIPFGLRIWAFPNSYFDIDGGAIFRNIDGGNEVSANALFGAGWGYQFNFDPKSAFFIQPTARVVYSMKDVPTDIFTISPRHLAMLSFEMGYRRHIF